jgi:uncharacterized alkaline shock family protein YloU
MEGHASIPADILGRYAADAAREVDGVRGLAGRRPSRIAEAEGRVTVEVHVGVAWEASIPMVGRAVQERVKSYLERMTELDLAAVNVVVDEIG